MNEVSHCPIWNTPASGESPFDRDVKRINSPRAGGWYSVSREALTLLPQIDNRVKARLTTWLVDQRRLGNECPEILQQTITDMEQQRDLPVHVRADRLLQYIGDQTVEIGRRVSFTVPDMDKTAIAAWSESVERHELVTLLEYLGEQDWIKSSAEYTHNTLTVEGYARLAELETANAESSQGFVAMWFPTNLPTKRGKKALNSESKMQDTNQSELMSKSITTNRRPDHCRDQALSLYCC